jgi:hypothetical protein
MSERSEPNTKKAKLDEPDDISDTVVIYKRPATSGEHVKSVDILIYEAFDRFEIDQMSASKSGYKRMQKQESCGSVMSITMVRPDRVPVTITISASCGGDGGWHASSYQLVWLLEKQVDGKKASVELAFNEDGVLDRQRGPGIHKETLEFVCSVIGVDPKHAEKVGTNLERTHRLWICKARALVDRAMTELRTPERDEEYHLYCKLHAMFERFALFSRPE